MQRVIWLKVHLADKIEQTAIFLCASLKDNVRKITRFLGSGVWRHCDKRWNIEAKHLT